MSKAKSRAQPRNVHFTAKEAALLEVLEHKAGYCFSREYLLRTIWGYRHTRNTRTLDVHISRLRRKLKRCCRPLTIHAVAGLGYVLRLFWV